MPMYVVLGKFTDEGAQNIKDLPRQAKQNMDRAKQMGMTVHGFYVTQGRYDAVIIVEAPDDQTMLAQNFGVAGTGRTRTETLRAYSLDEATQVIQRLG